MGVASRSDGSLQTTLFAPSSRFVRIDPTGVGRPVVCCAVLGPEAVHDYRIGVPAGGPWEVLVDTADVDQPATGLVIDSEPVAWQGYDHSVLLDRPTPSVLLLAPTKT